MHHDAYLAETKAIDHDDTIDEAIANCLSFGSGKSFITFAGAGSGKTYSLKEALDFLKVKYAKEFLPLGKQVAIVTFTNNAATEIRDRVERNPMFSITTIHSFCWLAISGFNEDIRKWYLSVIPAEIEDLKDKERRGRAGAASDARKRSIKRLSEKMVWLSEPRRFVYDPNGVNSAKNALSHADVLKIFAYFLEQKSLVADMISHKYPFIFVDESQDTDKGVINALFKLQKTHIKKIVIGLFGDTMQRIFGGGESELGRSLPENWLSFDKQMNHRSARRIVGLGNAIRQEDDRRTQFAREGAASGLLRFFLIPHGTPNKDELERTIRASMAELTGDLEWNSPKASETAVLLLEHKMVSRRLQFEALADALSKSSRIRDRLFEGDCSELNYFSGIILPLVEAEQDKDKFGVMSILRANNSPLLEERVFAENEDDPLYAARTAANALLSVAERESVTFKEVLDIVAQHNLLQIPTKLRSFVESEAPFGLELAASLDFGDVKIDELVAPDEESTDDEIEAWAIALDTPFQQLTGYRDYISEGSIYRTHQGVKGNEFERVMTIMDDDEAGGFMFSYEQYFGAKAPSPGTAAKIKTGEETGLDRTRRLFYVTSTRAKNSLAHVIYTADIEKVRQSLLARKLAKEDEIVLYPF